jgi:nucleotide-binding universal stress UspA family protein
MPTEALKRLLVAVDLTPRGHRALRRAIQLALAAGADLRLIYVSAEDLPEQLKLAQEKYAREELAAHAARAREQGIPSVTTGVLEGRTSAQIVQEAISDAADLIVVGPHRPSSFAQDLLGTTAGKILRSCQCPVLVARGEDGGAYTSVMVAVDFSPASRRALRNALEWFSTAHITVLSAYGKVRGQAEPANDLTGEARRLALQGLLREVAAEIAPLEGVFSAVETLAVYGWPEDAIDDFIATRKPGLVVLGNARADGTCSGGFRRRCRMGHGQCYL